MKVNISIVKKSDADMKIKIGEIELMGLPESIEYSYLTNTMKIKMHTIISDELAEEIFKEIRASEIKISGGKK